MALLHVGRLLEAKSRAVKPYGKLPDFVDLSVDLHVRGQKVSFNSKQEIQLEANRIVETSLVQAVTQDRRILLLGDLGTGKSTLAGMFVEKVCGNMRKILRSLPCQKPCGQRLYHFKWPVDYFVRLHK